jgi:hypothetical protein
MNTHSQHTEEMQCLSRYIHMYILKFIICIIFIIRSSLSDVVYTFSLVLLNKGNELQSVLCTAAGFEVFMVARVHIVL